MRDWSDSKLREKYQAHRNYMIKTKSSGYNDQYYRALCDEMDLRFNPQWLKRRQQSAG